MEFLQKTPECISHLTLAILPNSWEPAAYFQSPL